MSFDRFQLQELVEGYLGCKDLAQWKSYQSKLKAFTVTDRNYAELCNSLQIDATKVYYKGAISLAEGLNSLSLGQHSWALIKLYYATFYFIRCLLAAQSMAFVKNYGIFSLKLKEGEKPIKRDGMSVNGETIRGDHKTTIHTYANTMGANAILLSNKIDDLNIFEWMMKKREEVQYRTPSFSEPININFHGDVFEKNGVRLSVERYLNDPNIIYCFLPEHCCLATPVYVAKQTTIEMMAYTNAPLLSKEQQATIDRLLLASKVPYKLFVAK